MCRKSGQIVARITDFPHCLPPIDNDFKAKAQAALDADASIGKTGYDSAMARTQGSADLYDAMLVLALSLQYGAYENDSETISAVPVDHR